MLPEVLKNIKTFCKGCQTKNVPIKNLYERFNAAPYVKISQYEFEQGLLELNKGVIKDVKRLCLNHEALYGPDGYTLFVEDHQYITKEFWDSLIEKKPETLSSIVKDTQGSYVEPKKEKPDLASLVKESIGSSSIRHLVRDIPYKDRQTILDAVLEGCDTYSKIVNKTRFPLKFVERQITRLILDKKVMYNGKWNSKQRIVGYVEQESPVVQDEFADMLPVDWLTMTHPERVDFLNKIQHKGFYEYVLRQDSKLADFVKKSKSAGRVYKEKLDIYVTLFSFPANTTSEEAKLLIKSFVNSLNMKGRARLQYVECSDGDKRKSSTVEIREIRS